MTKATKALIKTFAVIMFGVMVLLIVLGAEAKAHHRTTNNYVTEVTEVTQVTESNMTVAGGLSRGDLLSLQTSLLAGGGHQFGNHTTKIQISVVGDVATSDWDSDNAFSFAIAKKSGKYSFFPNALYHLSYTPVLGDDHISFGVTVVLD